MIFEMDEDKDKDNKFDIKKHIFAVIAVNPKLECVILATFDTHEDAINYLTKYCDNVYKPKDQIFRVIQNTGCDFDVFKKGYFYKTLECKLQIIPINF